MFARALRRPCRGETWGRWRSSRASREPARQRLEVAHDERDQAGQVVGVPVAGGVRLAEAEAGRACEPAEDVVRGDGDDDRVARPGPVQTRPPGSRSSSAPCSIRPSARIAALSARRAPIRRPAGSSRSTSVTASPIPRRARTAACGRTARASARASRPAGGSGRSPAAASAGSGAARGRGSRRSKGVAAR